LTYQSADPFNGKLLESFAEIGDAQFETKIAAAETCFISWRLKSYAERAVVVAKSPD